MSADFLPVSSPDAETSIIHAVLFIPQSRTRCFERLSPSDFHTPIHRRAYEFLQRTWQSGCRFDDPTSHDRLFEEPCVVESVNDHAGKQLLVWGAAMTTMIELAQRRNLQRAAAEASMVASDLTKPILEVRQQAQALAESAVDHRVAVEELTNAEILRRLLANQEAARAGKNVRIPWHIHPRLDNAALVPGSLTILAGRPGGGKTAMAVSAMLAQHERSLPTGLMCFEMSPEEIMTRFLSQLSGLTFRRIAEGFHEGNITNAEWDEYLRAQDYMHAAKMRLYCDHLLDLVEIKDLATEWRRRHGIAVLYVDYAQLLARFIKGREPLREKVGYVSAYLKYQVAKPLAMPIVLLAQLNRDSAGRQPTMQDLKESGNLEEDAHNIILIDRPYASAQPGERSYQYNGRPIDMRDKAALLIDKARNDSTTTVFLHFEANTGRFSRLQEYSGDPSNLPPSTGQSTARKPYAEKEF